MFSHTGHPLLDIGIATLGAFVGKRDPSELTAADLATAVGYMERNYVVEPLKSFLTVAFPNSGFTQPAYERQPEKRSRYAGLVLGAYKSSAQPLDVPCPFTGRPAVGISLDTRERLPLGRAFRQHVPLLTSEGVVNFSPNGQAGLPISGEALLAFQALPLGCAKVGGRLLGVHSDHQDLTYAFAQAFLRRNLEAVRGAQRLGHSKMPEYDQRAKTLVISTLLEVGSRWLASDEPPVSLSVYHFSNSGTGVLLDMYHLPMDIFRFLQVVRTTPSCSDTWDVLCTRAWHAGRIGGRGSRAARRFNTIYEDLFHLPQRVSPFVRRHLLGLPLHQRQSEPSALRLCDTQCMNLVSWDLAVLFLRMVVQMNPRRIQRIQEIGDTLAEYVERANGHRLLRAMAADRHYGTVRAALMRAGTDRVHREELPAITIDTLRETFEHGEGLPYSDWPLARDLVLIRMIEQLCRSGWMQENAHRWEDR